MTLAEIMAELSDCICTQLTLVGWDGECCIWPGTNVSFDSCCETGGQAWIVVKNAYPTTNFPRADSGTQMRCGTSSIAQVIEVGVIRCVCADLCNCLQKEIDANKVLNEAEALLKGVWCCLGDDDCDVAWSFTSLNYIGPEGGCAGSRITLVVELPAPCCEE
jgi:hypothetical protein